MVKSLISHELRMVLTHSQMSGDPSIDLARTSFNPLLLLTDKDEDELERSAGVNLRSDGQLIGPNLHVSEPAAEIVMARVKQRLAEFLVKPIAEIKPAKLQRPGAPAKASFKQGRLEANFGGEVKLLSGRWHDGPPLAFVQKGRITKTVLEISPKQIDLELVCLVRKINSLACCLLINETSGNFSNFNGLEVRGDWRVSFWVMGRARNLTIDLHKLIFSVDE